MRTKDQAPGTPGTPGTPGAPQGGSVDSWLGLAQLGPAALGWGGEWVMAAWSTLRMGPRRVLLVLQKGCKRWASHATTEGTSAEFTPPFGGLLPRMGSPQPCPQQA
jgi:hypothetical protein